MSQAINWGVLQIRLPMPSTLPLCLPQLRSGWKQPGSGAEEEHCFLCTGLTAGGTWQILGNTVPSVDSRVPGPWTAHVLQGSNGGALPVPGRET